MKKFRFVLVMVLVFPHFTTAADKAKTSIDVQKEIQKIRPQLAKAEISSVLLRSGDVLAAATLAETEFYVKAKAAKDWTYLDKLSLDSSSVEFRKDGVLKISLEEGGTSNSKTSSLWRYENGRLEIIGQDSTVVESWAFNEGSKTTPYKTITSTNYLSGKKIIQAEFARGKKKKIECKFDPSLFQTQKIYEMTLNGASEPECPKK